MEAATQRTINASREYDYLFPAARNVDKTIIKDARLEDTLAFIHKVVSKTLGQTKAIANELKGLTVYDTCSNIWQFVYNNVAYKKDAEGLEQVRSPRRTWKDRKTGVDCDCYSTFISSILTNLHIPHLLRITKYKRNYFQHVYPVVPNGDKFIILDCVTDQFDFEVPYSEKKDMTMDLQYLDGLQGISAESRGNDIVFDGHLGELGKFGFLKKIVKVVNKVNPATVLLRNGFLAAMKLNLFKVASRIKYAYLSPADAVKRGIIKDKYDKLVKVKNKMESIFSTAGGNPKNLKKAILNGKGNKNKEVVAGLGFLGPDDSMIYMDRNTTLSRLLGPEIYYEENVSGMEGFEGLGQVGELGELGVAPFVAAASAAIAALSKLLKGVGNIFGNNNAKGAEDFSETEVSAADQEVSQTPAATSTATIPTSLPAASAATTAVPLPEAVNTTARIAETGVTDTSSTDNSQSADPADTMLPAEVTASNVQPATINTSSDMSTTGTGTGNGFWGKNKKWLLPTAIGIGGIAAIAIGIKLMKPATPSRSNSLNGPPRRKKNRQNMNGKGKRKAPVALL